MNCYLCNQRNHRFKPDENYQIEACINPNCPEKGKAYDINKNEKYVINSTKRV